MVSIAGTSYRGPNAAGASCGTFSTKTRILQWDPFAKGSSDHLYNNLLASYKEEIENHMIILYCSEDGY